MLPASEFSTGRIPASTSPATTARATSSGKRSGTGSAQGHTMTTASSLYAPRSPGKATRAGILGKRENLLDDRRAHLLRRAAPAARRFDVRRRPALRDDAANGALDNRRLGLEAEGVAQQHGDAEYGADRIRDAAAGDVRRRAVNWLVQSPAASRDAVAERCRRQHAHRA